MREYTPPIPYPARLNQNKEKEQYGKFLELFKQLHINIPFVEAISQMPKHAKFLNELLSKKWKLENVAAVISPTLHEIVKLPESFSFGGSLFYMIDEQLAPISTAATFSNFRFLDNSSFRNFAYLGIWEIVSTKGILI